MLRSKKNDYKIRSNSNAKSVFIIYGTGTVRYGIVLVTISLGKPFKGSKSPIIYLSFSVPLIILPVKINERRLINHLVKHVRAVRIFVSAKGLNKELFVFPYLEQLGPFSVPVLYLIVSTDVLRFISGVMLELNLGLSQHCQGRTKKRKLRTEEMRELRAMLSEREQRIASREGEQSTKYRERKRT